MISELAKLLLATHWGDVPPGRAGAPGAAPAPSAPPAPSVTTTSIYSTFHKWAFFDQ